MNLNVIDVVILLFLLLGAVLGFKKGAIQTVAVLVGTIVIIILAYILKNPLSVLLYTYLPFFKLGGIFKGISVVNILIYEAIAFLIVLSILASLLGIVLKITGIISKLIDHSIVLTLPSKIIGTFLGFLESYIFVFILLFIFSQFSFSNNILKDSKYTDIILTKTPFTSSFQNTYDSIKKISNMNKKDNKNYEALEILLENDVISVSNANKLIENGKLNIKGAEKLIEKYEVKEND